MPDCFSLFRQAFVLAASLTVFAASAADALAGSEQTSGTLRLAGHVAPRASVQLSRWALLPGGGTLLPPRAGLSILANNRAFTVSLEARNPDGQPRLLDPQTGHAVPYQLTYAGETLAFVDGQARLAEVASGEMQAVVTGPVSLDQGRYEDALVLVIKAR